MSFFILLKEKLKISSFFRESFKVMFLRISGAGFQFLALFFITNFASEILVGQFNYLNSMTILLGSLVLFGMNNSFLQFTGRYIAERNKFGISNLTKKCYLLLLFNYLLFLTVYIFLSRFLGIEFFQVTTSTIFDKVIIAVLPFAYTLINLEVLRGLDKLIISELFRNLFRFGGLFALVLLLILTDSINLLLNGYIYLFYLLFISSTILIIHYFAKHNFLMHPIENWNFKEILRVSLPMSLNYVSLLIMQSSDIFLLERYFTFEVVAYYGVAIKISLIVSIILSSINAIIAPEISKLFYSGKFDSLRKVIRNGVLLNFIVTTPIIILILIFSDYILGFFGSNYKLATVALSIILIGQMFNAFCGPVGLYFNMTGRQNKFQIIIIISLVINLILNIILIPKYEMLGAALSTAFSFVLWNIIGVVYVYKKDKINLSIFCLLISKERGAQSSENGHQLR